MEYRMMIYLFVTNDLFKYIIQYFTRIYVLITVFCQMRCSIIMFTAHRDTHTLTKHVHKHINRFKLNILYSGKTKKAMVIALCRICTTGERNFVLIKILAGSYVRTCAVNACVLQWPTLITGVTN